MAVSSLFMIFFNQNIRIPQLVDITPHYYIFVAQVSLCRTRYSSIELLGIGLEYLPLGSLAFHPMQQKKLKLITKNNKNGYPFPVLLQHLLTTHLAYRSTS